ncbi:unnamed protein product [Meloidogyne enterolobii]|uniref:Uncharacterized protein n=1 Tax=Meloidogyne enterolobii TaxID=390850 RepID=A0ACB0ZPN9_MELEN
MRFHCSRFVGTDSETSASEHHFLFRKFFFYSTSKISTTKSNSSISLFYLPKHLFAPVGLLFFCQHATKNI